MTSSHITKLLRAIIILAVAIVMSHAPALAAGPATPLSIPRESLSYKVMFKWGLINKKAGWARLDYSPAGATATAVLYAGSEPWADKLYYLRDTLTTRMSTANHTPEYYERVANEDGKYARDVVRFTRDGNRVTATTRRYRRARPGAELKQADAELEAIGQTVDMVSAFYYARTMPFAKMAPGQQRIINIFSAKKRSASPSPLPEQRPSGSTTAPTTPIISNSASPPTAASSRATTSTPGWRRLRPTVPSSSKESSR